MSVVLGMSDLEYHARPELSSSGARRILESPATFRWEQEHRKTSPAYDLGHAVHAKVLGTGAHAIAYPPEHLTASGNVSTKAAAVAWADAIRAAGLAPITPDAMALVDAMAEAVLAHPAARFLLEQRGDREASVFATDPDTGVDCRARFDFLPSSYAPEPIAVDLKTTVGSASRTGFGVTAAKYGYPIQEAFYADTLQWITGGDPIPLRFIVVEKSRPHLVAVHEFDEVTRMVGRELALKARQTFAECAATNAWPGYGDDVITTDLPNWWFYRADLDNQEEEMTFG